MALVSAELQKRAWLFTGYMLHGSFQHRKSNPKASSSAAPGAGQRVGAGEEISDGRGCVVWAPPREAFYSFHSLPTVDVPCSL